MRPLLLSAAVLLTTFSSLLQPIEGLAHLNHPKRTASPLSADGVSDPLWPPTTLHPWPGLAGIKHAFFFGDSYTTLKYDVNAAPHPSIANPLGLPYPGLPTSNGPNWVSYLTYHHNSSTILSFALAFGGATISRPLIPPFEGYIWDLDQQLSYWGGRLCNGKWYNWKRESSLAFFWFGINDVWRSWEKGGQREGGLEELYARVLDKYQEGWERVRKCGVGAMLVLNVPPIDLSPSGLKLVPAQRAKLKAAVELFNAMLASKLAGYKTGMTLITDGVGMHVFSVNAHKLFSDVIVHKDRWGFEEAERQCKYFEAYKKGADVKLSEEGVDERCSPKEAARWVWRDGLHPMSRVHWIVASGVAWTLG
ncbi:hypothetical protein BJ508DRAFT_323442 [Ascobolus immersus RN42]|uniref:SGNH hydrolase n=1 Tax=Ascobolus immersus RN42 TaxID=1160509 RepID=A0A3N4IIJ1_ASCIM|nr:hypothetical protein BJ508DRAFT_323442 [Ascobolus immersus RN42]